MQKIIEALNQIGLEHGGVLAIVALLFGVFGVVGFFKRNDISIRYIISSSKLIHGYKKEYDKLEVKFDGEAVENLTASNVLLFNDGRHVLRETDIPGDEFIGIELPEDQRVLDIQVVESISDGCNFSAENVSPNVARINFHHINTKNAVLLHVLHTGRSSKDVTLKGRGAGFKEIRKSHAEDGMLAAVIMCPIVGLASWAWLYDIVFDESVSLTSKVVACLIIGFIALFMSLGAWVYCSEFKRTYWLKKLIKQM